MWFKGGLCSLCEFKPFTRLLSLFGGFKSIHVASGRKGEGEGAWGGCFYKEICQEKLKGPFI